MFTLVIPILVAFARFSSPEPEPPCSTSGTDLFQAGIDHLLAHHGEIKRAHLGYKLMTDGYKEKLLHYMKLFNQCGKA